MLILPLLRRLVGVFVAMALLAGCSGEDMTQQPTSSGSPSERAGVDSPANGRSGAIAAAWGTQLDFRVELLTLARTPADAVIAKFRVTSYDPNGLSLHAAFDRRLPYEALPGSQVSGISLVDTENHRRYLPLADDEGKCLCTQYRTTLTLPMRHSVEFYAYFPPPPEGLARITIDFPQAGLFHNVPLRTLNRPPALPRDLPQGREQPQRRPTEISAEPEIEPLISREFDTDSDSASQRQGDASTVHLSARVLFDLNKATLRPGAREELREVGTKIAEASPAEVNIDGHTDSTGSPDINIPLSENRARAVQEELQGIVDDDSIEYVAEGHGADDPVADNDTGEGRQANRRVTITFER